MCPCWKRRPQPRRRARNAVGVMTIPSPFRALDAYCAMTRAPMGIVEEKMPETQRALRKSTPEFTAFRPLLCWRALKAIMRGEFYLTDCLCPGRRLPARSTRPIGRPAVPIAPSRGLEATFSTGRGHGRWGDASGSGDGHHSRHPPNSQDCIIDAGCVFEGDVILGEKVKVGSLRDQRRRLKEAQVAPLTHIEGATVGPEAQLGPLPACEKARCCRHAH